MRRRTLIAHGTAADIAVMAAILPAIVHQVSRLCDEWVAADATRSGRSSRDSYRKGVDRARCVDGEASRGHALSRRSVS